MTDDRPSFLIVNDDGVASPMLAPMAEKLSALGTVRIVVPVEEQSWRGKSVTRFGALHAEPRSEFGVEAHAISGTPSDCVNLAIHHLLPQRPDWIVSGINVGSNVGSGFIINSGTIGAALEGLIQGVSSVAFSTYLEPRYFREWSEQKALTSPEALQVVDTTTTRMAGMMASLLSSGTALRSSILNINFPGVVSPDTPVRWVPPQVTRYGSLFRRNGDGSFVHAASVDLKDDGEQATDRAVVLGGGISVTALSMDSLQVEPEGDISF